MKNKIIFLLMPVASMALTSCGQVMDYKEPHDDYVSYMEYHDNFNILQLTDIHWSYESSTLRSKKYLEKTIAEADRHIKELQGNDAKIDLVELTGDQFMLANTYHIDTFLKFFEQQAEKYGFYYAVIWGNHDRQGLYNANWLAKRFKESKHCIYKELNDNLYGRSNFVINLTLDGTKDSGAVWQVFNLDSGASFSETSLSPFRDYDYIRKDQTDWYVKEHEKVGETVPTLAYYHIPQDENETAWKEVKENPEAYKNKFFKLEGFADNGNEKYASDFIDVAREHGLKGAFMGHAHNVDWTVEVDGVVIGLGVKTGTELYFAHIDTQSTDVDMQAGLKSVGITENFDLIGASLGTIKDGLSFELEHLYLNERASGDFTSWVKW